MQALKKKLEVILLGVKSKVIDYILILIFVWIILGKLMNFFEYNFLSAKLEK